MRHYPCLVIVFSIYQKKANIIESKYLYSANTFLYEDFTKTFPYLLKPDDEIFEAMKQAVEKPYLPKWSKFEN